MRWNSFSKTGTVVAVGSQQSDCGMVVVFCKICYDMGDKSIVFKRYHEYKTSPVWAAKDRLEIHPHI